MRPPKPVSTPHIEAIQGGAQGPTRLEVGDTRLTVYTTAHFVLSLVAFLLGNGRHDNVGACLKAFVFVTLCSIGLLLDGRRHGFSTRLRGWSAGYRTGRRQLRRVRTRCRDGHGGGRCPCGRRVAARSGAPQSSL